MNEIEQTLDIAVSGATADTMTNMIDGALAEETYAKALDNAVFKLADNPELKAMMESSEFKKYLKHYENANKQRKREAKLVSPALQGLLNKLNK